MTPYGHLTSSGYLGTLEDGTQQLFPTEQEYLDYCKENSDGAKL